MDGRICAFLCASLHSSHHQTGFLSRSILILIFFLRCSFHYLPAFLHAYWLPSLAAVDDVHKIRAALTEPLRLNEWFFFDENEGKKNEIIKFQREWKEPFEKSNQMTSGETWIKVRKTAGRLTETVESRQLRWRKYKSFSLKHCRLTFYTRNKKNIIDARDFLEKFNSIQFYDPRSGESEECSRDASKKR